MSKVKILFLLLLMQTLLFAQGKVLEGYIQNALENNLALQQKKYSLEKSIAALKEARALFLPSVSLEARYSRAGGGRDIEFPVGDLLNPVYSTLNALLSTQQFPTLENEVIPFLREEEHETKLRLVQPIFQPAIYYNYKIKDNLVSADSAAWAAYKMELISDIKSAYYNYLQATKATQIYLNALNLVDENLKISESLVENGMATKDVLYRARSEKMRIQQQITAAQRQQNNSQNYFNFLLNHGLNESIIPDSVFAENSLAEFTAESAAEKAIASRNEIHQIDQALEARRQAVSIGTARFLPQVNVVVDYGFQGEKYRFTQKDDYWMASALLSWNLFNGFGDKAKREQAVLEYKSLKNDLSQIKQQIRLQAHDAVWAVQESEKQLLQSREQLKAAKEVYKIVEKKYRQGMVTHIEMIDAATSLTNAEITNNINKFEILKRQGHLKQVLGIEGV
ncbi:MAG: TolC family protein [Calditrichaeota bacterium]|nr:TolC family protein [Calditrichota bacterium]